MKALKFIEPPDFEKVQAGIKKKTTDYISSLTLSAEERRMLNYYYRILWSLVDSSCIWLKNIDVLLDEQLDFFSSMGEHYDKVIGNPPYRAWQN